jgi:hypothetical protein
MASLMERPTRSAVASMRVAPIDKRRSIWSLPAHQRNSTRTGQPISYGQASEMPHLLQMICISGTLNVLILADAPVQLQPGCQLG